ncbi:MAG: hypothetical protein ACFFDI_01630, partial [Promethearchaeota archaeon]
FLTPVNCSFRGWVDVNFSIPWNYPAETILDMPLRVQACLIDENFEVRGWIGRIMIRSFSLRPLTEERKEIPLSPQNQSQNFGTIYSWYSFVAQVEGMVRFPHSTSGIGISLEVEVYWTGIVSLNGLSTLKTNLAGYTWGKKIETNDSVLMRAEGEITNQSIQEEKLTVFLQMSKVRGDYINVYFHVFIWVWELASSVSNFSRNSNLLESLVSPTLFISAIVIVGGLLGGRSYHYRKWHQRQENIQRIVVQELNED